MVLNLVLRMVSVFMKRIMIVCALLLITFANAQAQQTKFRAAPNIQGTMFTYEWTQQDTTYNLQFAISNAQLMSMPDSPSAYNKRVFQEAVYSQVMQEAKLIDPRLARVSVEKNNSRLSFNVQSKQPGKAQKVLDKLSAAHEKAQTDYYNNHYFLRFKSPAGENTIRHDHSKYTQLSSLSLSPVVEAIKAIQQQPKNPREFVEIALSWIQSIPYDTLENRLSSNGAGFISPRDLLLQNQGDCDSKSTLMAALLKAYNPRINLEMVYLRDHALLGIAMRALPNDLTINKKGMRFVLLEPTGPAQLKIGEVADTTKMALRNRQFDSSTL
jgi:hypothetical protein